LFFALEWLVALFFAGCATQDSGLKTGVADIDPSPSMEITAIGLSEETDATTVVISGTEPLTYTSVKQPLPLGVVLYFPNTRLNVSNADVQSSGDPVTSIHAGQIEANNHLSH
jgi:type IV pilus assembly protein PilQ